MLKGALLNAIALICRFLADAGVTGGFSTFNFALTDGASVVVSRYCDKAPHIPSPSLYYAFADGNALREHLQASSPGRQTPGHGAHSIVNELTTTGAGAAARAKPPCRPDGCARGSVSALPAHADAPSALQGGESSGSFRSLSKGAFICASEPLTTHIAQWHLLEEGTMLVYEAGRDGGCSADGGAAATVVGKTTAPATAGGSVTLKLPFNGLELTRNASLEALSLSSSLDSLPCVAPAPSATPAPAAVTAPPSPLRSTSMPPPPLPVRAGVRVDERNGRTAGRADGNVDGRGESGVDGRDGRIGDRDVMERRVSVELLGQENQFDRVLQARAARTESWRTKYVLCALDGAAADQRPQSRTSSRSA